MREANLREANLVGAKVSEKDWLQNLERARWNVKGKESILQRFEVDTSGVSGKEKIYYLIKEKTKRRKWRKKQKDN